MKKTFVKLVGLICTLNLFASSAMALDAAVALESPQPPVQPAVAPFKDVPVGAEHYLAIKYLKDHHFIDGYEDDKFKPLDNINRAEALKIIQQAITRVTKKDTPATDATTETTTPPIFSDVPTNAWYATYVQQAVENKIVSGYPDSKFRPEQNINKVEALKMVLLQTNMRLPTTITEPPYSDVPMDAWFATYAKVAKDRGLLLEDRQAGALIPDEIINRGQFAELIYHMIQSNSGMRFGRATYYADELAGRGTSSGDPYKPGVYTTAHKTFPFGTRIRVTNLANGESVDVKVNDRGPYATGVELDLSKSAFADIASPSTGIIYTEFQILDGPQ